MKKTIKKVRLLILLIIILFNAATCYSMVLVFSDEFNGTNIDNSKWSYDIGTGPNKDGFGNYELQYYTSRPENISVSGGNLQITALRENYEGKSFTSGRIKTKGKFDFKYGKIQARIKLPYGSGIWPAFWMLGNNFESAGWPKCGEIDVMEMFGGDNNQQNNTTYSGCFWYDETQQASVNYYKTYTYSSPLNNDYHIYEIEWNPEYIISRFDGIEYFRMDIIPGSLSELRNNEYFLLLNLAVGGNKFIPPINDPENVTATLPQTMFFDWIRVYQP